MVQTTHMGLIAHELETIYQRLIQQQMTVSPELIAVIRLLQDDISDRVQVLREQQLDYPANNALNILQDLDGVMASAWQTQSKNNTATQPTDAAEPAAPDAWSISLLVASDTAAKSSDALLLDDAKSERFSAESEVAAFLANALAEDEATPTELTEHAPEMLDVPSQHTEAAFTALDLDQSNQSTPSDQIQHHLQSTSALAETESAARSLTAITDTAASETAASPIAVSGVASALESVTELEVTAPSLQDTTVDAAETAPVVPVAEATATTHQKTVHVSSHKAKKKAKTKQSTAEAASFSMAFDDELSIGYDRLQRLWQEWTEQRSQRSVLLQLQRNCQLMQRMAMQRENHDMANLLLRLESIFEQFSVYNFQSGFYDASIIQALDWLQNSIYQEQKPVAALIQLLSGIQLAPSSQPKVEALPENHANLDYVKGRNAEPPSMMGAWEQSDQNDQSNEMIRVSADVIEKMIDLSGENAINRSRIEMDLGQLATTLQEMEQTIQRLADQLRRMEGELETQILAKHEHSSSRYTDFDPLEMDQYSSLNQLSKSLAESASDLVDFKITLANKIRDTESLLLQQSRIQAEIQESLMRTRLVPFSRLLPRLQRIVRQTSSTLNRPAELVVQNTEGELDRSILERLVTPLEHMLRNAIDHGLEDREQRLAADKPEMGLIELNIQRQGTDVVVTFSDDGKGIDVARVQQKAEQMGLLAAGQSLEKEDILQFIFHPGFSTASSVTQISGRGVGLDVVLSDIKTLGGHVSVSSTFGKGTTFVIRVPTTVAVGDALMVRVGDQQFALPLAQIDRIVRIAPTTLAQYFASQEDQFSIDHVPYKLRYLGEFTDNQPFAHLSGVAHSLPVILIKGSSGQTIALLVDQLIGSRSQIVVKPVGQQFANVGVIAGATILGDGQVCLILDAQHLVRQIQATVRTKQKQGHQEPVRAVDTRYLIMIVDDSVTVRKVTSRLLERQGFEVVTAKDGVDAMEQLETIQPDLMLLDIEMPRMDGFEVTNLVRHHSLHAQLPIIMITSRAGEKHRERAFSLGVNHYMGKPFQEVELLNNIQQLLTVTA